MKGLWALAAVSIVAAVPDAVEAQFFSDSFDTYANGSLIAGQGGWETWDNNPAVNTTVVNTQAFSSPHSLNVTGGADIVHRFTGVNSGIWYVRTRTFVPATQTGELWFILLNQYAPLGPANNWSVQVVQCVTNCLNGGVPGQVVNLGGTDIPGTGVLPLITDQWVDIRVEINFGTSMYSVFYNETLLDTRGWQTTGTNQLEAIDLFSAGSTISFMDNVWVDPTIPVELQTFQIE